MGINLSWTQFYTKTDKYQCKKYLDLKKNFKIEKYLEGELKIFKILFNDIKMENEKNKIDYYFYYKIIIQEINSYKNNNESEFRFNWEREILL